MCKIFIHILFLFIVQNIVAQKFYVQVETSTLPMGQTMEIMFTAENLGSDNIQIPNFTDFVIVEGPNYSISTNIINTSISETRSWSLYIQPKHAGICKIPPAVINTSKGKFYSKSVDINITGSTNQNNNTTTSSNTTTGVSGNKHFILKAIVNKNAVLVNEDIVITYKLYIDQPIQGASFLEDFNNSNFSVLGVYNKKQDQITQNEMLDGKPYLSIIVQKTHINAHKVGKFTLAPLKLNVNIKRKDANLVEKLTGADIEDILIQSNALNIDVKELPTPLPVDFKNAIGSFTIACSLNKSSTKTDEPLSYKVVVSGKGNMKNLSTPTLNLPDYFEIYDPTLTENITLINDELTGDLTYTYLITPHEPGNYKLSPATFVFFNNLTQKYEALKCDSIPVSISGKATPYNKTIINPVVKDSFLFILKNDFGKIVDNKNKLSNSWYYYLIISFPLLLLSVIVVFRRYKKSTMKHQLKSKQDYLEKVNLLEKETDHKEVCKNSNQIIKEVLLQKFPNADLSSQFAINYSLEINVIHEDLKKRILSLIENNEKNIYTPFVSINDSKESLDKLRQIIEELMT